MQSIVMAIGLVIIMIIIFFHPSSIRTALIPNGIFKDMHRNNSNNNDTITTFNVLDIGCNEGDLTIDIYTE